MNEPNQTWRQATACVHAGSHLDELTGGVCTPIYTSTAYSYPNRANLNIYPRYFNVANQQAVARKVAALEKGEEGLVFGSGMAAISGMLLAHLSPGDHAIFQADLYGGTYHLAAVELKRLGVEIYWAHTVEEFEAAVRPNTRLLYIESPSNPLLHCIDLAAVAQLARKHRILSLIDNTFATPVNQNPLEFGIDAVLHSATKYLNGHSDLNAGVVVSSKEIIGRAREFAESHGGMLESHACYQLERGLKTLFLRVKAHNENAAHLAAHLQTHPAIARVNYPGLAAHPDHAVAARQMRGFGGMISFELREPGRMDAVLARLRLITPALSLGGVESLICAPSRTSHRGLSPGERRRAGISDGLLRLSVGVEDARDLVEDIDRALES